MAIALAVGLGACALGIEVCANVLAEGATHARRPYALVAWDVAADRMRTGDVMIAYQGVFSARAVALVVRDASDVLYALIGGRGPQPLCSWLRRQTRAGAQCCWRPLSSDAPHDLLHLRIAAAIRPRDEPLHTLLRAGVLRSSAASLELLNLNTAPGMRYDAPLTVLAPPVDFEKSD